MTRVSEWILKNKREGKRGEVRENSVEERGGGVRIGGSEKGREGKRKRAYQTKIR